MSYLLPSILKYILKRSRFFNNDRLSKKEGMDKRLHSLTLLLAISMAAVRSSMDGIFSNPEIMEWKQNLAVSERSGKYSILSQAALKIPQTFCF